MPEYLANDVANWQGATREPGLRNTIQIWQPYRYDVLRLPEKSFHILLIKSMYLNPAVNCFY